jgi:hypothetical protein
VSRLRYAGGRTERETSRAHSAMSRVLAGEENRPGKFNDCRRWPGEEGIETANPVAGRLPPPGRRRDPPELYDFSVALGGPLYQILRWTHLTGDALAFLHRTAS